jgi:ferredoxin
MKTTIFYFSGTGNCLKIARDLAAQLKDAEVVSVAKAVKGEIDISADRIGLVFPVYAFNPPLIVLDFIRKLQAPFDKYIFAITTYAGAQGCALWQVARHLKQKGLNLSAGFGILMPSNYTPFGGAIPLEKQEELFAAAFKRTGEIADIVRQGRPHKMEGSNPLWYLVGRALYPPMLKMTRSEDKHFRSDEKCNNCGICEKVCPVNNIAMAEKKPVWLHKCEQCFACLQWCPQEAIQCGKNTAGRKRYHNPAVSLKDFLS